MTKVSSEKSDDYKFEYLTSTHDKEVNSIKQNQQNQ